MFGSKTRMGRQSAQQLQMRAACDAHHLQHLQAKVLFHAVVRQIFRFDKVTKTRRLPQCENVFYKEAVDICIIAFICSGHVHEIIMICSLQLCFICSWQNLQCHKSKRLVWLALLSGVTSADSSKNRNELGYRFLSDSQHICLQTSKHQIHFHESLTLYLCFSIHEVLSWESIFCILAARISAVKGFIVGIPSDRYAIVYY